MWTVFTQGNYICMESLNTDPSKVESVRGNGGLEKNLLSRRN